MGRQFIPHLLTLDIYHSLCIECKPGFNDLLEGKVEELSLCKECTIKFDEIVIGGRNE